MKRFIFIAFVFALAAAIPRSGFAANELTFDDNFTLQLPSDSTLYSVYKNGKVNSFTINSSSFSFTMEAGSVVEMTSADRKRFDNNINAKTVCQADNTFIRLKVEDDSPAQTVTVTPTGNACTSAGGGVVSGGSSSSASSSGGGGGTTPAPSAQVASAPPIAPVVPAPVVSPAPIVSVVITRFLNIGSQGDDVKSLQEYLARDSELYPEGTVSGYFGPATRRAVQRFQEKYGIASAGDAGYGLVGPKTRAKLAELTAQAPPAAPEASVTGAVTPSPTPAQVIAPSVVITRSLVLGAEGDDVTSLQEYLARDPELYPEGLVTGFFGPATRRAIQRFQEKYGIASAGDSGYGLVGPKTRAKLEEVTAGGAPSAPAEQTPSATAPTPTPAPAAAIERNLTLGSEGEDVTAIQEYLGRDPELYPDGRVTGYFGTLTRSAVQRFQEKYGIASAGDSGYGLVGPKTRAKFNELISGSPSSGAASAPSPSSAGQIQQEELLKQIQEVQKQIELLKSRQ